ncbi:hypothetical protein QA644_12010 [Rhizobium sp. CC1099]|uniref:hypothetical protein n=1 Tax=Rhizobium sp. CC1099 TaxID=3039160 RepID=UPI0024B1B461|nr:hypothetical protein [Rhizobium sp. CC1099]WFU85894.1 hypothetical protein QA644_12010 [Rhizobium sp. CC1099]
MVRQASRRCRRRPRKPRILLPAKEADTIDNAAIGRTFSTFFRSSPSTPGSLAMAGVSKANSLRGTKRPMDMTTGASSGVFSAGPIDRRKALPYS